MDEDCTGHSPLGLACIEATGNIAIPYDGGSAEAHERVDELLANGADPSEAADNGWAPLHTAAMAGHPDLAARLLDAGADPAATYRDTPGSTPLALACFYAQSTVAAVLADAPGGPHPDNLRTAACLGNPLDGFFIGDLEAPTDDDDDLPALTAQAGVGREYYRPILAFPEWTPSDDPQEILDEALAWCVRHDRLGSMDALVGAGADVNANVYRGTPMLWAAYAGSLDAIAWLAAHGADPNLRHDFGGANHGFSATALHLAAQFDAVETIEALLQAGADTTIRDGEHDATPIQWAEHMGSTNAVAALKPHTPA